MSEQRDVSEEASNRHTLHTGDGELSYCQDTLCPSYVLPERRDAERVAADLALWEDQAERVQDSDGGESFDTALNRVDGHWYDVTYGLDSFRYHAMDCAVCVVSTY